MVKVNTDLTLEGFQRHAGNKDAYQAVLMVASCAQPDVYNPTLIVGDSGVDKTHLLQGAANFLAQRRPNLKVRYLTGGQFAAEYKEALATDSIDDFRARYQRGIDVLIFDDFQELVGKDAEQHVLSVVLRVLKSIGCSILIASSVTPEALSGVPFHLMQFLKSGLTATIRQPTRKQPRIEKVQREVAGHFGLKVSDIKGPRRHQTLSRARQIAMFMVRKHCHASYPEIGKRFGGRDHSTVITSCRKIERLVGEDTALRHTIEQIERQLVDPPAHLA